MIKFSAEEILIKFEDNKFKYHIDIQKEKIYIRRTLKNSRLIDYIMIKGNNIDFFKYDFNLKKDCLYISKEDKYNTILEILNALEKNNLCSDVIDIKKLKNLLKNKNVNILIANESIALSSKECCKYLDIISLETYEILGYIYLDYDVKIKVDSFYYEQVLSLLKQFLDLNNNNKHLKYMKS